MSSPQLLREWLNTRPEAVRQLAVEFPLRSLIPKEFTAQIGPGQYMVLGYTEDDHLIITPFDPSGDYDRAYAAREYVCAKHLRNAE